ncbi:hypothetical protein FRC17_008089 [Serendipita sp. 399]|nr:hypothetical protein FRC17_008089 [Serendipita sp. 399]
METYPDKHTLSASSEEGCGPQDEYYGVIRVVTTGFGHPLSNPPNPSFQISQALPSTLTIYRDQNPQIVVLERHPDGVPGSYEYVVQFTPKLYDQYAGGLSSSTASPFFIHMGSGHPGRYELERLAHRDGYAYLDGDQKPPPLQNTELPVGSRTSIWKLRKGKRSADARGYPFLDSAETLHTGIDVQGVVDDVRRDMKDLTMPIVLSNDAGRFLCDFVYYSSLREAAARFGDEGLRKVLFVHVPPDGTLEEGVRVLEAIIKSIVIRGTSFQ